MKAVGRFTGLLALMILLTIPVVAQEQTSSIQGVVSDMNGDALPGVTVMAVSERGVSLTAYTDVNGRYRFPAVPPGTYDITASLAGMENAIVEDVFVRLGSSPKVDLKIGLSAVTETITVTSAAPVVDVTSSSTTTEVTNEQMEKLPLGRDFTSVVKLAAGANDDPKAGGITIDGASGAENVFVLDGVNVTNPEVGISGKVVITDVIDTVQVKSAGYSAEYGGATGGVINVITKSGTNDIKGQVNLYYEDESLNGDLSPSLVVDANDPTKFAYESYENDDNTTLEPGFLLGGPIIRDRLWAFGAYEPIIEDNSRTVSFIDGTRDTFTQDFRRDNAAFSLSGALTDNFLFKGVYNTSGYEQENLLPNRNGRVSSDQGDYTGRVDDFTNWTASGYLDYVVTPDLALSLRAGRFNRDLNQSGYPDDPFVWFWRNSTALFSEIPESLQRPSGFTSAPTPFSTQTNEYIRDNVYLDASWFPTFAGTHAIKAGVQVENLENNVLEGYSNYVIRTAWGTTTPWWGSSFSGEYGQAGVYVFQTKGNVTQEATAFFLQDSWTTLNDRLTLNLGVRAEQEKVPNYADPSLGLAEYAIEFDFGDKTAPRLGFAYDISGDGTWKAYGSYGTFFDLTKMEMPRGSFGGDKWIWFNFAIDDYDWTKWSCTGVGTNPNSPPTCSGLSYIGAIDLRQPSLDLIEPNLKPMESEEMSIGTQYELSPTMAVGARYVHKELIRTIEDVGVLVTLDGGGQAEQYFTANPGEGVATNILGSQFPAFPKPVREYDALELDFTRRFSNNWSLYANYVYSELFGNYSGLANSDEALLGTARTSPNVTRYGDSLFNAFDASGSRQPVLGKLSTDRPHQFKAQVAYAFDFGTLLAVNQYIGSGTPISTEFEYHGVPFFPFGRGDQGRTETLTQTDLMLAHEFRIMDGWGLELGVNVLNLFDEDNVLNVYNLYSDTSVELASDEDFFAGFDPYSLIGDLETNRDPRFGQANYFQDPREVRFHAKLRF